MTLFETTIKNNFESLQSLVQNKVDSFQMLIDSVVELNQNIIQGWKVLKEKVDTTLQKMELNHNKQSVQYSSLETESSNTLSSKNSTSINCPPHLDTTQSTSTDFSTQVVSPVEKIVSSSQQKETEKKTDPPLSTTTTDKSQSMKPFTLIISGLEFEINFNPTLNKWEIAKPVSNVQDELKPSSQPQQHSTNFQ